MKRFLLFAYNENDAAGGWVDFQQDFDTLEEAKANLTGMDNHDIVDLETGKIVWSKTPYWLSPEGPGGPSMKIRG